jgi:hypothetical protein
VAAELITRREPSARLVVDHLVNLPDPFLVVIDAEGREHYVLAWDEKGEFSL